MEELFPTELNVFTRNAVELAFIDSEEMTYSSLTPVSISQPCEFLSIGYGNKVKDLTNLSIHAKLQVVKSSQEVYKSSDNIQGAVINNILASLIKSVGIYFNQTLVYSVEKDFSIKSYLESVLSYDHPTVSAVKEMCGFFAPEDAENKIKEKSKNSKIFDVLLNLNCIDASKYLIPNVSLNIKLTFNNKPFFIHEKLIADASDSVAAKYTESELKLHDITLIVPHKTLRESHLLQLEHALSKQSSIYQFKKSSIVTAIVPSGLKNFHLSNLYQGVRPTLVLACFMKNSEYSGDSNSKSYDFNHQNMSSFNFLLNDVSLPSTPLSFNFSAKETTYCRVFNHTMSALGLKNENDSNLMRFDNYKENFFIVSDITAGHTALTSLSHPIEPCLLGVSLTFNEPLAYPLSVILYIITDSEISIDLLRNIQVT